MADVTPQYNFTAEKDGANTVFRYKKTPISYKLAAPLCFYTAIPAVVLAVLFRPSNPVSAVITWLVLMIGLGIAITALINALRKTGEFKINDKEIIVKEKHYANDHISAYFIKDPAGNNSEVVMVTVRNNNPLSLSSNLGNLQSSVGQMGRESRMAIRKHLQNAGYKICIRYGTKDIAIAKGLGEQEADVMLRKIREAAQL